MYHQFGSISKLTTVRDESINELYARTASSQFVVAKRIRAEENGTASNELYLLVGRKDASLTDAEREFWRFGDQRDLA
jgi:hypothetical protein